VKAFIFNADDLGCSPRTDAGIIEAARAGIVNSASLLVTAPGAAHSHAMALDAGLEVGLHLNLTSEAWIDPSNETRRELVRTVRGYEQTGGPLPSAIGRRVQEDVTAQFELFVSIAGDPPAHVNHHRFPHAIPGYGEVYAEAAATPGVPGRHVPELAGRLRTPDHTEWRFYPHASLSVGTLLLMLDEAPPGVTEVVLHPGLQDRELVSSYRDERQLQLGVLIDRRLRDRRCGGALTLQTFSDL
jgi:chitin disaccharide deacetylase